MFSDVLAQDTTQITPTVHFLSFNTYWNIPASIGDLTILSKQINFMLQQ